MLCSLTNRILLQEQAERHIVDMCAAAARAQTGKFPRHAQGRRMSWAVTNTSWVHKTWLWPAYNAANACSKRSQAVCVCTFVDPHGHCIAEHRLVHVLRRAPKGAHTPLAYCMMLFSSPLKIVRGWARHARQPWNTAPARWEPCYQLAVCTSAQSGLNS